MASFGGQYTGVSVMLMVFTCALPNAHAQVNYVGEARWWWEASSDGGTTYAPSLIEVSDVRTTLLVRSRVQFPASPLRYFGSAGMDAAVFGASAGDDVSDVTSGERQGGSSGLVYRLPSILKIDGFNDPLPPGEGPNFLCICQDPPWTFPQPSFANPITVMTYNLHLDGTPGDRVVRGVLNPPLVIDGRNIQAYLYSLHPGDRNMSFAMTVAQEPLIVRVVPAPSSAFVFAGVGALALAPRRRRT